ncbi:hypothetical protein C5E45_08565 [Nocardia nova]|uniref:Uncharacterized protein n=1 Tax=Nocardia nova TaxID=37330 RepID=A0A2S6AUF6_9NOCA|nr:hypothetical protein C5E41_07775 [Nocardia nova]PPJ38885.1 hypothetical protein C5E45_08565 [Nocardia nova]
MAAAELNGTASGTGHGEFRSRRGDLGETSATERDGRHPIADGQSGDLGTQFAHNPGRWGHAGA